MLLLGHIAGSYDLDVVLAAGETIRTSGVPADAAAGCCSAFARSAQFPLHFWLPGRWPADAGLRLPAFRDDGEAGVFLLARLHPAIAGTDAWFGIVTSVGLATLVVGAWSAICPAT